MSKPSTNWIASLVSFLTPRRLRAQAIVLALCLWGVCAVDYATPGIFDRAGNIKFQDFLPIYVSARLIRQHRASQLYDQTVIAAEIQSIIRGMPHASPPLRDVETSSSKALLPNLVLPNLYGPQVGYAFLPLSRFSFLTAAQLWVAFGVIVYTICVWLIWRSCPALRAHGKLVAISAAAFPPLFHFFVRGQPSVLILACFTVAYFAFRSERDWLAGIALGVLVFKPQFLVAVPLVLLLAGAWRAFLGLVLSAAAQLALTWIHFGPAVMRSYFETLLHISRWISAAELSLAPIQMHSLRSFWALLIPWPPLAFALYILTSLAVIAIATAIWKSTLSLSLRFSVLTLAAVLVNPHLFIYDLLVLAPAFLLIVDWSLSRSDLHVQNSFSRTLLVLAYLAIILPLLGPLSRWTHLQLSVPVFVVLLWMIYRCCSPVMSFRTVAERR